MSLKKIGLLGGTFDPIHFGHLQLAEAALAECGLDKVVFIPSAQPPHKDNEFITPFHHRLAMLGLAWHGRKEFECNSIEGMLPKPSYTVDTLRALREHYTKECHLYFMIGADAFLDILSWKAPSEVLQSVNFIVSRRRGYGGKKLSELLTDLGYKTDKGCWRSDNGNRDITILDEVPAEMSSSAIRQKLMLGQTVTGLVPESVLEYIRFHRLYRLMT